MKRTNHHFRRPVQAAGNVLRSMALPGLFIVAAVAATYPVAARLSSFSVLSRYADTLLQAWTLAWDAHAVLSGPSGLRSIWDANIFYPYPLTLAFSEHLLPTAFILLPFTLLGSTPLAPANLGILFTTALSGWGVYLLVLWLTGNRQAGIVAGLFFAVSPFRMGHLVHLNLLSTHWLPFAFLALARLIRRNKNRDLILLILFVNLQFASVINYATMIALALAVWGVLYLLLYRKQLGISLGLRLLVFAGVTLAVNWPVLNNYRQVNELMGVTRTLGDARILAASLANYLHPMANSLLYSRGLKLPTLLDSAFPGVVILALAAAGLVLAVKRRRFLAGVTLALLIIVLAGLTLSFGANEAALGPALAPVVAKLLPYPYLYQLVPFMKGFRVPARFALLVTFGLALLAGIGFAGLGRRWWPAGKRQTAAATLAALLILAEHIPAPIPGETVAYPGDTANWLARRPAGSVVLELPYYLHTSQTFMELPRQYRSARHWQRLVNGNSGFEPAWLVELGRNALDAFPDWRAFDVLRQMGVNYVVLHRDEYDPAAWDNLLGVLPGYLPAIRSVSSPGNNLVLQLNPPACRPNPALIRVNAAGFPALLLTNTGPATLVTRPQLPGTLAVGPETRRFLEPLFILPGQTLTVDLPANGLPSASGWQVHLPNLDRTLTPSNPAAGNLPAVDIPPNARQPVQIPFAGGVVLQTMALGSAPHPCGVLALNLEWSPAGNAPTLTRVSLVDRFGRMVASSEQTLAGPGNPTALTYILPLAETVPAGRYRLQVELLDAGGTVIKPIGPEGAAVDAPVSLPVVIHPRPPAEPPIFAGRPPAEFANGILLLGANLPAGNIQPGEWLRFTLAWQSQQPLDTDLTVFTQLLGPDGRVWGQQDNQPRGGWYGTSLWQPGQVVTDDYAFQVSADAPPGEYRLLVGWYNSQTLERLPLADGTDFVEAGVLQVGN